MVRVGGMSEDERSKAVLDLTDRMSALAADSGQPAEVILAAATANLVATCIVLTAPDREAAIGMMADMAGAAVRIIHDYRYDAPEKPAR